MLFSTAKYSRMLLLSLLLSAATINIVQFRNIDEQLDYHHKAFYLFDTSDIVVLALRLNNVWNVFNLYGTVRQVAPGITLMIQPIRAFTTGPGFFAGCLASAVLGVSSELRSHNRIPRSLPNLFHSRGRYG